jgi:hypothetical protein
MGGGPTNLNLVPSYGPQGIKSRPRASPLARASSAETISTRPPAVNLPLIPQPTTAYDTIIASKPQYVPASDHRRWRSASFSVPSLSRGSSSALSNPHRAWTNAEGQTDQVLLSPSPMSPSSLTTLNPSLFATHSIRRGSATK